MKNFLVPVLAVILIGCTEIPDDAPMDPTERGLWYVAGAILGAAIIRAIFNR